MASARDPLRNSTRDRRLLRRPTPWGQTKTRGTPGVTADWDDLEEVENDPLPRLGEIAGGTPA